jgi:hypothetical protein
MSKNLFIRAMRTSLVSLAPKRGSIEEINDLLHVVWWCVFLYNKRLHSVFKQLHLHIIDKDMVIKKVFSCRRLLARRIFEKVATWTPWTPIPPEQNFLLLSVNNTGRFLRRLEQRIQGHDAINCFFFASNNISNCEICRAQKVQMQTERVIFGSAVRCAAGDFSGASSRREQPTDCDIRRPTFGAGDHVLRQSCAAKIQSGVRTRSESDKNKMKDVDVCMTRISVEIRNRKKNDQFHLLFKFLELKVHPILKFENPFLRKNFKRVATLTLRRWRIEDDMKDEKTKIQDRIIA